MAVWPGGRVAGWPGGRGWVAVAVAGWPGGPVAGWPGGPVAGWPWPARGRDGRQLKKAIVNVSSEILEKQHFSTASVAYGC